MKNRESSWSSTTLPRWTKKVGVLRWTNEKVIDSNKFSHYWTSFRETIFRPLGGAAPWNFLLHTLEIEQGLLAHTRRGTGSPPPKKNHENLKFGLQFSVVESITSGIVKVFSLNFSCVPLLREEFYLPELILHSDLRRRAASRRDLPRTSS